MTYNERAAKAADRLHYEYDQRCDVDGAGPLGDACEAVSKLLKGLASGTPIDEIPVRQVWHDVWVPVSIDDADEIALSLEHHALENLDGSDGETLWAVLYALAEIRSALAKRQMQEMLGAIEKHRAEVSP